MRIHIKYDPIFRLHVTTNTEDITKLFVTLEFSMGTREFRKLPDPKNIQFPHFMSKSYPEPPIAGQIKEKDIYKTVYDCSTSFGEFAILWPIPDKIAMIYLDKLKVVIKGDNAFTVTLL